MKRIAIIDDEHDARESLRILIGSLCPDVEICGEAHSVEQGYAMIRQTNPDPLHRTRRKRRSQSAGMHPFQEGKLPDYP